MTASRFFLFNMFFAGDIGGFAPWTKIGEWKIKSRAEDNRCFSRKYERTYRKTVSPSRERFNPEQSFSNTNRYYAPGYSWNGIPALILNYRHISEVQARKPKKYQINLRDELKNQWLFNPKSVLGESGKKRERREIRIFSKAMFFIRNANLSIDCFFANVNIAEYSLHQGRPIPLFSPEK